MKMDGRSVALAWSKGGGGLSVPPQGTDVCRVTLPLSLQGLGKSKASETREGLARATQRNEKLWVWDVLTWERPMGPGERERERPGFFWVLLGVWQGRRCRGAGANMRGWGADANTPGWHLGRPVAFCWSQQARRLAQGQGEGKQPASL